MDATNRIVAGWILEERLGSGGFGEVWKARRRHVGLARALKLVPVSSQSAFASWRHEIDRLEDLSHPNIVRFYDADLVSEAGPYQDYAWIATELCARSLADELEARDDHLLSSAETAGLVDAMLGALAAAHGRGCVHRDIKPANVLLHASGVWKLCDFGTARLIPPDAPHPRTAVVGTSAYMSPAAHRGQQDQAADLYALGVTGHEVLCGERLHPRPDGMTDSEYVKLILDTPPVISPRVGEPWRALVAALIGADGPHTAAELLARFRASTGAVGPAQGASTPGPTTQGPPVPSQSPPTPAPTGTAPTFRAPIEAPSPASPTDYGATHRAPTERLPDREATNRQPTLPQPGPPVPSAPARWTAPRGQSRVATPGDGRHIIAILGLILGSLAVAAVLLLQLFASAWVVVGIVGAVFLITILIILFS